MIYILSSTFSQCNVKYQIKKDCERKCINVNNLNVFLTAVYIYIFIQHKYCLFK